MKRGTGRERRCGADGLWERGGSRRPIEIAVPMAAESGLLLPARSATGPRSLRPLLSTPSRPPCPPSVPLSHSVHPTVRLHRSVTAQTGRERRRDGEKERERERSMVRGEDKQENRCAKEERQQERMGGLLRKEREREAAAKERGKYKGRGRVKERGA